MDGDLTIPANGKSRISVRPDQLQQEAQEQHDLQHHQEPENVVVDLADDKAERLRLVMVYLSNLSFVFRCYESGIDGWSMRWLYQGGSGLQVLNSIGIVDF